MVTVVIFFEKSEGLSDATSERAVLQIVYLNPKHSTNASRFAEKHCWEKVIEKDEDNL